MEDVYIVYYMIRMTCVVFFIMICFRLYFINKNIVSNDIPLIDGDNKTSKKLSSKKRFIINIEKKRKKTNAKTKTNKKRTVRKSK